MTDSKFCEHGVNVGLKNPPVFCGQCPPDTIATLRADLASVRLDYANECDRARRAEARHERDKSDLRADLARQRGDTRTHALVAWRLAGAAGYIYDRTGLTNNDQSVDDAEAEIRSLRAELARVTGERDNSDRLAAHHMGESARLMRELEGTRRDLEGMTALAVGAEIAEQERDEARSEAPMGKRWFEGVYAKAQVIAEAWADPNMVTLAIELACKRFGGPDGKFNAANFSAAYVGLKGLSESLDGNVVRSILCKRDDVWELPGGAHFQYANYNPRR